MGVVDHDRPGLAVAVEAEGGGVSGERQAAGRAGLDRKRGPVVGLAAGLADPEMGDGAGPLHCGPPGHPHEGGRP